MPEFPGFKSVLKILHHKQEFIWEKEQILICLYSRKGYIIKRAKWAAATDPPIIGIGAVCLTYPNIIRIYQ